MILRLENSGVINIYREVKRRRKFLNIWSIKVLLGCLVGIGRIGVR